MKADGLSRMLRPLWRRIYSMLGRGVVTRVDEGEDLQKLQVRILAGELRDRVHVLGHYGLTSYPDDGSEAVLIFLEGGRDNGVAISVDDRRQRPTDLERAEVRLYAKGGASVSLKPGGDVEIRAGTGGSIRVIGDAIVTGDVEASGDVSDGWQGVAQTMAQMRQVFDAHVHGETGGGGPTTPPATTM